tara:strand:- start:6278 stop:6592 length:315 start_codon:yes stop_codon:yes gene_type:complete
MQEFDYNENPVLKAVVDKSSSFKELVVNYVGEQHKPENDEVTVEMVVTTMLNEFPEFLFAIAEENFIRGYQQALSDVESSEKAELEDLETLQAEFVEEEDTLNE